MEIPRHKMKQLFTYLIFLIVFGASCTQNKDKAQTIVDQSIEYHGGKLYEISIVDFDFRGRHYTLERKNGLYKYHRIFEDSAGVFHDILSNDGFKRLLNDREISVDELWASRYSSSINSVAYFAYLPFGLNDPAVIKSYLGEEEVNGNLYEKVRVTFEQEGGGEDYDDLFVYWFNKETAMMEFFGYSYVSDGGGIRFREQFDAQKKNGLTFSNYINFKASKEFKDVSGLAAQYSNGNLQKLSEIRIENLEVKRNE